MYKITFTTPNFRYWYTYDTFAENAEVVCDHFIYSNVYGRTVYVNPPTMEM